MTQSNSGSAKLSAAPSPARQRGYLYRRDCSCIAITGSRGPRKLDHIQGEAVTLLTLSCNFLT